MWSQERMNIDKRMRVRKAGGYKEEMATLSKCHCSHRCSHRTTATVGLLPQSVCRLLAKRDGGAPLGLLLPSSHWAIIKMQKLISCSKIQTPWRRSLLEATPPVAKVKGLVNQFAQLNHSGAPNLWETDAGMSRTQLLNLDVANSQTTGNTSCTQAGFQSHPGVFAERIN